MQEEKLAVARSGEAARPQKFSARFVESMTNQAVARDRSRKRECGLFIGSWYQKAGTRSTLFSCTQSEGLILLHTIKWYDDGKEIR
jgi:hypothetical protein